MDDAADGLLALSTTAAALAENVDDVNDDDRSSSLSELEDAPENLDLEMDVVAAAAQLEADSEAETERLEESPDKLKKKPFGISPSKLAHSISVDERPEIEALTDSNASSPISPIEDSDPEQSDLEAEDTKASLLEPPITNKRKRLSDVLEHEDRDRVRRRRTGSIDSDEEKDGAESDNDEPRSRGSREPTIEPLADDIEQAHSDNAEENEDEDQAQALEQGRVQPSDESKGKKPAIPSRTSRRRGKGTTEPDIPELDEENEAEDSDEDVDADDADVQAKSAEEQAKRAAAMDALTVLEQRFATLRDRLYDERIAQINHELAQLAESEPSHPEFLRQLECVRRYRDNKFAVEQKLLVFKIGALKRKSIAERSQIHSAYFQTARDVREKHVERISEQFYRIQRDRFKSNAATPSYTIPFAEKRSQQITQQTAYNKEVSILSGVAKWKGFPAAPDLPASTSKELEEDMEKMGISLSSVRAKGSQRVINSLGNSISAKAAGEQFLEQTPWANPQHPMSRLGINRQLMDKSPFNDSYMTPAHQQRTVDSTQPVNSASTIPEHPSQPASAFNTPHEHSNGQRSDVQTNGIAQGYRVQSTSPTETRKAIATALSGIARPSSQPRDTPNNQPSSPLTARANLPSSPKRTSSVQPEKVSRNDTSSPFKPIKENSVANGLGPGRRVGVQ